MAYSEPQKRTLTLIERDRIVTDIFYGGGAGSGKTFLGCEWQIMRRLLYPETRGFIGRNTFTDFKVTTLKTFVNVWNTRWQNNHLNVKININLHEKIILFSNGSEILIKDLSYNSSDPEFNTLGGMELTDAFIDEVPEITKKAKDIIRSRIRYKLINRKPVLLMTGNPTPNWVKDEFVENRDGLPVVLEPHKMFIPALLYDNPNKEFVEDYEKQLKGQSIYDMERLLYGNWSVLEEAENPFLWAWDDEKHISQEAKFNPNIPTYFNVDFNVSPLCALVIQHQGATVFVVDEILIEKGSVDALCDYIEGYGVPIGMIRITGDAMGNGRTYQQRDNSSAYMSMKKRLKMNDKQFMIIANPTHKNSREDCNAALIRLNIKVNPKCKGFIFDAKQVNCDAEGHIIKSNRKLANQRADLLDDFRYFVNAILKRYL